MKKLVSVLLVLVLCLGLAPVTASAGDTVYLMDVCPPYETPRTDYTVFMNGRTIGMAGEPYGNGFVMSR